MDHFTAVYKQDGDWWVGYVEELPGAHTQGRTLEEARENLKEATRLIIEANRDLARQESEGASVMREPLVLAAE
jgi:predicted RNase H-like HicB family nuclease